jgi:hypothetical protein
LRATESAQENLVDIRHKLSVIYKHIQLMHNELRYQANIHTISEKLKKIKFCIFSPYLLIFVENNKIEKQQGHACGRGNNI